MQENLTNALYHLGTLKTRESYSQYMFLFIQQSINQLVVSAVKF